MLAQFSLTSDANCHSVKRGYCFPGVLTADGMTVEKNKRWLEATRSGIISEPNRKGKLGVSPLVVASDQVF